MINFAFRRLEPYAVKVASTVLRRGSASNGAFLSDKLPHSQLQYWKNLFVHPQPYQQLYNNVGVSKVIVRSSKGKQKAGEFSNFPGSKSITLRILFQFKLDRKCKPYFNRFPILFPGSKASNSFNYPDCFLF